MGIVYRKTPDALDLDAIVREKIRELYGRCPYCGSGNVKSDYWRKGKDQEGYDSRFLKLNGGIPYYKREGYVWVRANFKCRSCGGEWQSDRYPTGLSRSHEVIAKLMEQRLTGNNVAMIVIKRSIANQLHIGVGGE